jgi:hypothetical protein
MERQSNRQSAIFGKILIRPDVQEMAVIRQSASSRHSLSAGRSTTFWRNSDQDHDYPNMSSSSAMALCHLQRGTFLIGRILRGIPLPRALVCSPSPVYESEDWCTSHRATFAEPKRAYSYRLLAFVQKSSGPFVPAGYTNVSRQVRSVFRGGHGLFRAYSSGSGRAAPFS